MHITQMQDGVYFGFIGVGRNRVSQEDHQVDIVIDDLRAHLLFPAQTSGKVFVYDQIGSFFHQSASCACGINVMFAQDVSLGDAEVFHQFFFVIVSDQTDIHKDPPSKSDLVSFFLIFKIRPMATMFVHMEEPP